MKRFVFSLLALVFSSGVQAAPTINVAPNQASYQPGDTVLLAVSLSESPKIHGGGLNVRFNPGVLQAQSVVVDAAVWRFASKPGVINNTAGGISEILFSSFTPVEGDLGVAIIQMAVVGLGDSGFSVTTSEKNPFVDANAQIATFSTNTSFAINILSTEQPTEETPEQVATTQTEAAPQTVAQTTTQTTATTQNTSTDVATTTASNNVEQGFARNVTSVSLPNTTVSNSPPANDNQSDNQSERQFYLPSGPDRGIPVTVTDDNGIDQTDIIMPAETTNRYAQSANSIDETQLASAGTASENGQSAQTVGEMQQVDDTDSSESNSSINYLTIAVVLGIVVLLVVVFKVIF